MASIGIADKVTLDAINTKASSIQTTVGTINTSLNNTNTNIGSNSDAASASGSTHAKLKELRTFTNTLVTGVQKPRRTIKGSVYVNNTGTLSNLLSISGKGSLKMLGVYVNYEGSANFGAVVRLSIDGNQIGYGKAEVTNPNMAFQSQLANSNFFLQTDPSIVRIGFSNSAYHTGNSLVNFNAVASSLELSFRSSLLIEGFKILNNPLYVVWIYDIEA